MDSDDTKITIRYVESLDVWVVDEDSAYNFEDYDAPELDLYVYNIEEHPTND